MRVKYITKGGVPTIEEIDCCEKDIDTLRFFRKNHTYEKMFATSVHTPQANFLFEQLLREGYIDLTTEKN